LPATVVFAWRHRTDPSVQFCVVSILPGWLLFELAPTKLPHYVLPFVPLFAVLASACSTDAGRVPSLGCRVACRIGATLFGIAAALIAAVLAYAAIRLGNGFNGSAALGTLTLGTLTLVATSMLSAIVVWRGHLERAPAAAALCGAVASLLTFAVVLPSLTQLWIADRAAQVVRALAVPAEQTLVVGYSEPSLVFLLGTGTRLVDADRAATLVGSGTGRALIVAKAAEPRLIRALGSRASYFRVIAVVRGIDPVHGHPMELGVWQRSP